MLVEHAKTGKDVVLVNPLLIPSRTLTSVRRTVCLVGCAILAPLLLGGQTPTDSVATRSAQRPEGKLVLVTPGTVIEKEAPQGWSHLILKSQPRISPAHQSLVSQSTNRLASLVFTSVVARVERISENPARYALGDIGLGLGTNVRGRDMVLSPQAQARLGANLGLQERIVLDECYKRQNLARDVVRTPTMAMIDTHAVMVRPGAHRLAKVRYAVLLDPHSGQIATLTWGVDVDRQGTPYSANTALEWLAPNQTADCVLYVDPQQFTLGIPNGLAFAVNGAPRGHSRIPLTPELATLAGQASYTKEAAHTLETTLRNELSRIIQQSAKQRSARQVADDEQSF